jgi:hypothetical protein
MTLLPIFERELRVRARSRASYWTRSGLAALGIFIALPPLAISSPSAQPAAIGRAVFDAMVGAGFVLSCCACLLTSESISGERREGTLGLLFLTRVKHVDVLLGKFASSGLTTIYVLVGFLPVLIVPVLAGGVTGGEAVRKGVVLLDTLCLALSAGLWASARGRERFKTGRAALLLMVALVLAPELVGLIAHGSGLDLASPLGALVTAGDTAYKTAPWRYWLSLFLLQVPAWGLLFATLALLRANLWSEERISGNCEGIQKLLLPEEAQPENPELTQTPDEAAPDRASPGPLNASALSQIIPPSARSALSCTAPTPLHWLFRRQRGLKGMLWIAAVLSVGHYISYSFLGRFAGFGMSYAGIMWSVGFVFGTVTGAIFAWVASRYFVEARRTGELELLLTTPAGAQGIVSAQWDVLKRWVRWPVVVMVVPALLQGLLYLSMYFSSQGDWWRFWYCLSILGGAINTVLGVMALCWVGFWFALHSNGQARAIIWTVALVKAVPYALTLTWSVLSRLAVSKFAGPSSPAYLVVGSFVPQLLHLVFFLVLIRLARRQLRDELSGAEPLSLRQIVSNATVRTANVIRQTRNWPPV